MKIIDVICYVNSEEQKQKLEKYFACAGKLIPASCGIFYFMIKVKKK